METVKLLLPLFLLVPLAACSWLFPEKASDYRIENTETYWRDHGFAEMVPAVRLPGRRDGSERIKIWLKLPEGKNITARQLEEQHRTTLEYPPGTIVDRAEYHRGGKGAFQLLDIRGTRVSE